MADIIQMPLVERAERTHTNPTMVVEFPRNPKVRATLLRQARRETRAAKQEMFAALSR